MRVFIWDSLTYSRNVMQHVAFVVVYLMYGERLISWFPRVYSHELLNPPAPWREKSIWCKFHLHIMFGLWVIKNFKESQVNARIVKIWCVRVITIIQIVLSTSLLDSRTIEKGLVRNTYMCDSVSTHTCDVHCIATDFSAVILKSSWRSLKRVLIKWERTFLREDELV